MINFHPSTGIELKPRITVIGVGGAGGNAVNNMIQAHLEGVEFIVANTDAQAMSQAKTDRRLQLGTNVTRGLGAGARPDIGRAAAEESLDEIMSELAGSNMLFITAGMGGGTGTGAAPVIARAARQNGILTVGVVTKPFHFEGKHRMRLAESGIEELSQWVDTLIIIPNQNLFRIASNRTTFAEAFKMADEVLHAGVRGVTDLMMMPGLINLDFADIRSVMSEMGKAMMGTGEAEGEDRALQAAEAAISNPLLEDTSMKGARGVLINITGGMDMTLFEVDEAANRIRDEVDPDANIIFGSTFDEKLEGRMRVSVVATGIENANGQLRMPQSPHLTQPPQPDPMRTPAAYTQAPAPQPQQPQPQSRAPQVAGYTMTPPLQQALGPAPQHHTAPQQPAGGMYGAAPVHQQPQPAGGMYGAAPVHQQPQPAPQQPSGGYDASAFGLRNDARPTPPPPTQRPQMSPPPRPQTPLGQPGGLYGAPPVPPQPQPEPPRSQSLFSKLTSGRSAPQQPQPAPQAPPPQRQAPAAGGLYGVPPAAPQQPAAAPRPAAQPQDRQPPAAGRGDDDVLDIPAFLRRQSN